MKVQATDKGLASRRHADMACGVAWRRTSYEPPAPRLVGLPLHWKGPGLHPSRNCLTSSKLFDLIKITWRHLRRRPPRGHAATKAVRARDADIRRAMCFRSPQYRYARLWGERGNVRIDLRFRTYRPRDGLVWAVYGRPWRTIASTIK